MGALLPAATPDLIVTTFANSGDVTAPPQTDPNGFVNFQDGYGPDYELDLDVGNTEAKGVERTDQNYLFAQNSIMAQWWQSMGISPWYSTMSNRGTSGYNAGALVGRVSAISGEWVIWRSLEDANTVDPNTNGQTVWDYVPTDADLSTMFAMPAGGQGQKLLPGGITTEQILAATNFNSLVTGTFEYVTDTIAAGSANAPSNFAGMVECKLWSNTSGSVTTTFGVQRYLDRTGAIWVRGMRNGTWTTWATFSVTYAAVVAALGFVPANSSLTVSAGTGLAGGGALTANVTLSLAPITASSILANPTAGSAAPIACTLLNGIILNSPANTLGLGTITPANVASSGYVNGTTASFSGALGAASATLSGPLSATTITGTTGSFSGAVGCNGVNSSTNITIASSQPALNLNNNASGGNNWIIQSSATGGVGGAGTLLLYNNTLAQELATLSSNGNFTVFPTSSYGLTIQSTSSSNQAGLQIIATNGGTAPNKTIRTNGVSGNMEWINSNYSGVICLLSDTGNFTAMGTIQPGSDIRVKDKRKKITGALEIVEKYLVGHTYYRTDLEKWGAGFIAQSVKEGLPKLVGIDDFGSLKDFHTVDYNGAEAYVANAVTELHDIVKIQASIIEKQNHLIEGLEKRLIELESRP